MEQTLFQATPHFLITELAKTKVHNRLLICKVHTNIFSKQVVTAEKARGQVTMKFEQIFAKTVWLITIKKIFA